MRKVTRPQVVAGVIVSIWAFLLILGLAGGSISFIPRPLTQACGLFALVALMFIIPGGALYGLLRKGPEAAADRSSLALLAIQRRWRFAISGSVVAMVGAILVLPSARATVELRIAGVVALAWGLLCVGTAFLAFRRKRAS